MREEVTDTAADSGDVTSFKRLIKSSTKKKGKSYDAVLRMHSVVGALHPVCAFYLYR